MKTKGWIPQGKIHWLLILLVVILGFWILFISMVKASCPALAREEENFSLEPIKYQVLGDDGSLTDQVYELPYSGILPPHPLYVVKRIRDWMWLKMTKSHYKKGRLLHRFADREMGAAVMLMNNDKPRGGLDFAQEAIKRLEEAYVEVEKEEDAYTEAKQIKVQLKGAGVAYEYKISEWEDVFDLDQEKWDIILKRIQVFNLQDEKKE